MNCIVPMQAARFCKTLFRCVIAAHSHHRTVMIVGRGIAFQQANEHGRILILRANLAFVRTKALLTAEVSITFSKLYRACRYRKNVMSRKINYIKIAGCLTAVNVNEYLSHVTANI